MSVTATASAVQGASAGQSVNFARVTRSEWIKLRTVPSTVILLSITLVAMVGFAVLNGWSLATFAEEGETSALTTTAYTLPTSGITFGQLLIASLAVVLICSEWATGMIRSTMMAVPKRTPAILAKNLVIAVVSFVVGVVAAFVSYYAAQPLLAAGNLDFALVTGGVPASIINTGTNLALIAVISMSIGTLLRNTAGALVTALGLFLVLPVILGGLASRIEWVEQVAKFLPTNAGDQLVAVNIAGGALNQWQGGLVMAAWALVPLVLSLIITKLRDV